MDNKKLIIAIFIIVFINMIIFLEFNRMQMKDTFKNAENIAVNLEHKLHNSTNAVKYLHLTALHILQDSKKNKPNKILNLKKLDAKNTPLNEQVNLFGVRKSLMKEKNLKEIEDALELAPFLKLIYHQNKHYAWVYYYSKHHFTVLYPYVSAKDFHFNISLEKKPFFQYATPKLNPQRKLFFTPLYKDAIGKGLMITVGKPLYFHNEFMGTIDVDITLNNIDNVLSRLDYFNNQSVVYNEKNQIIASHNIIKDFNRSKIYKINNFLASSILNMQDTLESLRYVDFKYVFVKTLDSTKFRFIYIANAYTIWLKSLAYTFLIFMLMLFSLYLIFLNQKSKKLNQKLKLQTIKDYMTGAYNRRYFFEVAQALYFRAKRKKNKIAVIMIDIDDFKIINDTYGHDNGDIAIIEVRKILEKNLRQYDLFARFGGEEFCILLDEISKEDVEQLFEKIRKDFENNVIKKDDLTIKYTVSFGIAYGMMDSLEKMIKQSDEALYESKKHGKNQVTIYEVV